MLPLDQLFERFLRDKIYLKNISPRTSDWYEWAWKAFRRADTSPEPLTKARLQAFVIALRERELSPVSCNTHIKALNAFCAWLHSEGHSDQQLQLTPLKVPKQILRSSFSSPLNIAS